MGQTKRLSGRTVGDHGYLRLVGVSVATRATLLPNTGEKSYRVNTSLGNYVSVALVMCDARHNLQHPEVRVFRALVYLRHERRCLILCFFPCRYKCYQVLFPNKCDVTRNNEV